MANRFRHERLLEVKDLMLRLKSISLRDREDEHLKRNGQLAITRDEKRRHLKVDQPAAVRDVRLLRPQDLQIQAWYTEQLNEDLRREIYDVRVAEEAVHKQRQVVEKSAMEMQSLEKLKERHLQVANLESEREDQKALNEMAARQHSRAAGLGRT